MPSAIKPEITLSAADKGSVSIAEAEETAALPAQPEADIAQALPTSDNAQPEASEEPTTGIDQPALLQDPDPVALSPADRGSVILPRSESIQETEPESEPDYTEQSITLSAADRGSVAIPKSTNQTEPDPVPATNPATKPAQTDTLTKNETDQDPADQQPTLSSSDASDTIAQEPEPTATSEPPDTTAAEAPARINKSNTGDSGNWTIQIVAVTEKPGLEYFIRQHALERSKLVIEQRDRAGRTWWTAGYGRYSSAAAAMAAADTLPASLGIQQPFVRRIGNRESPQSVPPVTSTASNAMDAQPSISEDMQSRDDNARFLALEAAEYVVQLASVPNPAGFAETAELVAVERDRLFAVKTRRDGQDWWLLLLGPFNRFSDAQAAIEALPQSLKASGPWIRKAAAIRRSAE